MEFGGGFYCFSVAKPTEYCRLLMKKLNKTILFLCLLALCSKAISDSAYDDYFTEQNGNDSLTDDELKILEDLQKADKVGVDGFGLQGSVSKPGEIVFTFGASRPTIVCAVLELCDIALEKGEKINTVQIGDAARWIVDSAVSGTGNDEVQHLVIKPLDNALKTSMVITTDKRTYHLSLKSSITDFMPQIRFIYPEDTLAKLNQLQEKKQKEDERNVIPGTGVNINDLNFNYEIEGDEKIRPTRVYHDRQKSYIEFPEKAVYSPLPALVIVNKVNLFSEDDLQIANYRIVNNRYIVDGIIERARLILGDNDDALTVDIIYKEE